MIRPVPKSSLRNETVTKLRAALVALELAEHRLDTDATHWPADEVDMTPHEIEETKRLIHGIAVRVRTEIAGLQPVRRQSAGNA